MRYQIDDADVCITNLPPARSELRELEDKIDEYRRQLLSEAMWAPRVRRKGVQYYLKIGANGYPDISQLLELGAKKLPRTYQLYLECTKRRQELI